MSAPLNDLSPDALKAAIRGGTDAWGQHGSIEHIRYAEPLKSRRKCHCGCCGRQTHIGKANGVGLSWGCELSVRRWVKDPFWQSRRWPR
jgi:hypothetical protein